MRYISNYDLALMVSYLDKRRSKRAREQIKYNKIISGKERDLLLKKQNECCAICGTHQSNLSRRLAIDHNHDTGVVRGLLCSNCNTGLGMFKGDDGSQLLKKAIRYLIKFSSIKR